MMKLGGALLLLLYGGVLLSGFEPFTNSQRGTGPSSVRRAPGGLLRWTGGLHGGK